MSVPRLVHRCSKGRCSQPPEAEATQMPTCWQTGTQNVVHAHTATFFRHIKGQGPDTCCHVDGPQGYDAQWGKPDTDGHRAYDSTDTKHPQRQNTFAVSRAWRKTETGCCDTGETVSSWGDAYATQFIVIQPVNILKATKLYALNGSVVQYANYISKLLYLILVSPYSMWDLCSLNQGLNRGHSSESPESLTYWTTREFPQNFFKVQDTEFYTSINLFLKKCFFCFFLMRRSGRTFEGEDVSSWGDHSWDKSLWKFLSLGRKSKQVGTLGCPEPGQLRTLALNLARRCCQDQYLFSLQQLGGWGRWFSVVRVWMSNSFTEILTISLEISFF